MPMPPRETSRPRTAILVLGCRQPVYQRCIQTIRATWGATASAHTDIFYVYGAKRSTGEALIDLAQLLAMHTAEPPRHALADGDLWVSGDMILCGAADVLSDQRDCILRKRLLAFGYLANERGYDFVYNVCASSYVDVAALERYVDGVPRSGVYHGAVVVHGASGFPFVSGASFLLSRDVAAELAKSAEHILATHPESMPDDVVIGHFIASKYGGASLADIARRIATAAPATANQTFVVPDGGGSMDFVAKPEFRQIPEPPNFHFHFHSGRMWEMENFHRRFFAADPSDGTA